MRAVGIVVGGDGIRHVFVAQALGRQAEGLLLQLGAVLGHDVHGHRLVGAAVVQPDQPVGRAVELVERGEEDDRLGLLPLQHAVQGGAHDVHGQAGHQLAFGVALRLLLPAVGDVLRGQGLEHGAPPLGGLDGDVVVEVLGDDVGLDGLGLGPAHGLLILSEQSVHFLHLLGR